MAPASGLVLCDGEAVWAYLDGAAVGGLDSGEGLLVAVRNLKAESHPCYTMPL